MSQVLVKLGSSLLYILIVVSGSAVHQSLLVFCSSLKTGNLHSLSFHVGFILLLHYSGNEHKSSCCTVDA